MIASLVEGLKLPDLRRRILFTLAAFAVYTFCLHVPVPGVDHKALENLLAKGGALFGLAEAFTGGALRNFAITALGLMPYINASIIMQVLQVAIPSLERMSKEEGEWGRRKIAQWTRYLTIVLAALQGAGWVSYLRYFRVLAATGFEVVLTVLALVAGTCFLMWLAEEITEKGIGNGVSLLIAIGIVAYLPRDVISTGRLIAAGSIQPYQVFLLLLIFLGTVAFIVFIHTGQRRIPVQYAKRIIGTRLYGGTATYLPIKVDTAGVIPIIFAISILLLPATLFRHIPPEWWDRLHVPEEWQGVIVGIFDPASGGLTGAIASAIYFLLVVLFTYFYTAVIFNPADLADNLRKFGGFIPGIRPGEPTREYIDRVLSRLTFAGAIFLGFIALLQYWVPKITRIPTFTVVGGTSILIMVGVVLDTIRQLEAHLVMRHYRGLIR
ncbi:MAG TPA: preprotein translocase subunit SecY [Armatimonadetes bacterium]|nr:preprotein translocase subunit SecY [Armatimonadota bacterium]